MLKTVQNWPRALHRAHTSKPLIGLCSRCWRQYHSKIAIKKGDVVLLKRKGFDDSKIILVKLLESIQRIQTPRGFINAASIIGKGIRDIVLTNSGVEYRIHQPTMAEYIISSPRLVTPVYPANANLIVSLLDLHPPAGLNDSSDEPLEIFEAGTGHGSLTLHLARAIHGFNQPPPSIPSFKAPKPTSPTDETPEIKTNQGSEESIITTDLSSEKLSSKNGELNSGVEGKTTTESLNQRVSKDELDYEAVKEVYESYLTTRRAIVQTLDISPRHSAHAESTIRQFRHGLYLHNIDFHTGTINEYLSSRLYSQATSEPAAFLTHAILDLPTPHKHFDIISQALKSNGALIVFCPNITQIIKCVQLVTEKRMPFLLETVLEVGAGHGVGGRQWDVRPVKPRALLRAEAAARGRTPAPAQITGESEADHGNGDDECLAGEAPSHENPRAQSTHNADNGWEMVCRPLAGCQTGVGGFIALWRRMSWERTGG